MTAAQTAQTAPIPSAPAPARHAARPDVPAADPRAAYRGERILARGRSLSCDTWATGLNDNMLVLGPSGSGKTRHVLKPNLLAMNSSYVVLDTKGVLADEVGPVLEAHGYRVMTLNLADLARRPRRPMGFDPLAHIRRDPVTGAPNQQDVVSLARAVCPVENRQDPFWDFAASNYLAIAIAYAVEILPRSEQTFESVIKLVEGMGSGATFALFDEVTRIAPGGLCDRLYRRAAATACAERMHASIIGIIAEKVMCLGLDSQIALYRDPDQIDFAQLGRERCALFVTMSDTDRSLDAFTNLFLTFAFRELIDEADRCPGGRLPVPVQFFLDDFANLSIPDFPKLIAVMRSREIWCTVLCQTLMQLDECYGPEGRAAITANCDVQLVLGFLDSETARFYAERANRQPATLLADPLGGAWLFIRGSVGERVERYRLEEHPLYAEMLALEAAAPDGDPAPALVAEVPLP